MSAPAFVITRYGPFYSWTPERGSEVTYCCNAQRPSDGSACSLPAGHPDPRHSWERPAAVLRFTGLSS